ncbi:hypothetical protein LAV84_03915 [Rhizobium sp. VS19-DR104.2]|nr:MULTISPECIES: hypothetical protein [Rhizobium]MBZ5758170.1 hypothetical protein [Rhizobium sp. VS19-DR96]MBZ5765000.1 hypothetical protein [Rhizobium sp. VS19-DR129.2]MBZ5772543.1 hypothetical protein [Rhizobium sp. VS19-DRK62.2]MBZ5782770.1 hypothetical protein [Rhizobium sp. VS19-DR121]MBZ5800218.1 hypothetical protein [Rhizobium sp. VS19-DR181]MBZ5816504.1 hypothetical protein [Rhizobium sp. VS19-DR183]MBZ5828852.1 hypothetical protein [Rhizobium sp. VS19-DR104.2]MBZ5840205.1 hypothet
MARREPSLIDKAARTTTVPLHLTGAVAWGALMTLSAALALYRHNGLQTDRLDSLLIVYFLGGALAWPLAVTAAGWLSGGKPVETRFAACLLCLALATMSMTAFLFALDYRVFYSRWHAPAGSLIWMFQFVFTGASAVYQFGVLGSRLFLPLGLIWLPTASYYLARRLR